LYPDRANQYREDQERHIGEPVMIGGYTTTVTDVDVDDARSASTSRSPTATRSSSGSTRRSGRS
jgi:hypothetical protein